MPHRPAPARVLLAAVLALTLTGCTQAEEAATGAANRAGCAVAQKALNQAQSEAEKALDEIDADPEAARRKLGGMRDAVKAAESGLSGETKEKLAEARRALDTMAGEAQDAAQGADVDTSAVDNAKDRLDDAVGDVRDLC
ncbi:hypothetical protein GCM10027020_04260 [Nocardioides salsibiostraticola]